MKILYIARDAGKESNGASMVMKRNLEALKEIAGSDNLVEYCLPKTNIKDVLKSMIFFCSYGITRQEERNVVKMAKMTNPDICFIESSSYGSLVMHLAKLSIRTICFAHNFDTILCRQELTSRSPLISFPKYCSTLYNEWLTTKYADKLICLNNRDSDGFFKTFKRVADIILPITFPNRDWDSIILNSNNQKAYFLFVGSDFFPNVEGICWFIREVAPYVELEFRIVGSCCRNQKLKNIELPDNVTLVGYTRDLESEYVNACGVIAPIFKGSGMKTKTIEALSYGKSIFGTDEAFAGIDCDYEKIGALCNTANEFISALNKYNPISINNYSLNLFSKDFSDLSFRNKLEAFIYEQSN